MNDATRDARGDGFKPRLESLRGIAALAVVIFHINLTPWIVNGVVHPIRTCDGVGALTCAFGKLWWNINGISAVLLFFVLSGYVLTESLQRQSRVGWSDAPRYTLARLFRLYPAIFFMVAVFGAFQLSTGIAVYGGDFNVTDAVKQALLLETRINGATYTLQLELIGSALLFVAFQGDRQWAGVVSWLMFVVLTAFSFWPAFSRILLPFGGPQVVFLSAFLAGMLSARYAPRFLQDVSAQMQAIILLLASAAFVLTKPVISQQSGWMVLSESVSGAVIVGVLAQGRSGALLDWRPIRFMGRISYSFYLMHGIAIVVLARHIETLRAVVPGPDLVVSMSAVLIAVAITLPLAWVSYRLIELPTIHLGKRITNRLRHGDIAMKASASKL